MSAPVAVLIPADLTQPTRPLDLGSDPLAGLQAAVGGWIEAPFDRQGAALVCNEEGKLRGLRVNTRGTWLWGALLGEDPPDVLVGDVVLVGSAGATYGSELPARPLMLLAASTPPARLIEGLHVQAAAAAEAAAAVAEQAV